jgi:transcriptional regulator with XRE-family HTH domain
MSNISKIIGERIKNQRNQLGLTQEELAAKCGLHNTYIGQLERGEKNATLESIEKVVQGLGTSFETLFENLIPGGDAAPSIAAQCYDLVDALPLKDQQAVLDMILKMVEYKKM